MPSASAIHPLPTATASLRYATWAEIDERAATGACPGNQVRQAFQPDPNQVRQAFQPDTSQVRQAFQPDKSQRQAKSLTYPFVDKLLGPRERRQYESLRNPRRQREWLAGRTLAKQLIADEQHLNIAPQRIEIISSAESRRPQIWICGRAESCSLSIAHSSRGVLVALAHRADMRIGIDLCERTPLSASFMQLWFTADERAWLAATTDPLAANQLWAAKEALYKACNQGEGFDPRQISARPGACHYRGTPFDGSLETFECDGHCAAIVQWSRHAGCLPGHPAATRQTAAPNLSPLNYHHPVPTQSSSN